MSENFLRFLLPYFPSVTFFSLTISCFSPVTIGFPYLQAGPHHVVPCQQPCDIFLSLIFKPLSLLIYLHKNLNILLPL